MKRVEKILEMISIALLVLMTGIISMQVITRMLNHPFIWTEELSRYTLIYITFLGAALAYYKGNGLRITMLVDKFSARARKINDAIMLFSSIILVLCLIYGSLQLTLAIWGTPTMALQWNKGLVILVIPVGFSLILIKLYRDAKQVLLAK